MAVAPGAEPLEDPRREMFCITYIANGWKRSAAYTHGYGTSGKSAKEGSNRLLRRPEVQKRLRFLLRKQGEERVAQAGIQKDAIDGRMWAVAERCMQHEKVETPAHLKGRAYEPCPRCKKEESESNWCARCKRNLKLFEDWQEFGGVYKFDSRGVVQALLPLGRDRGLYIDKKLVGHMDGDDIIDAMNDKEVRELVRSLATEVGLRVVEAGGESPDGSSPEQGPHLQAVR